jgi:hypothetical protein
VKKKEQTEKAVVVGKANDTNELKMEMYQN